MDDAPNNGTRSISAVSSVQSPSKLNAQSIRRIMREWREIESNRNPLWTAWPIDLSEPYEWHFTVRGPSNTPFEKGIYHGRLVLPVNYPMQPPALYFLTPNGRFEINKRVCLSASDYHPECWQPAWSIRSMLEALVAFLPSPAEGAVNSLDWPDSKRRSLAEQSGTYICPTCEKSNAQIVAEFCPSPETPSPAATATASEPEPTAAAAAAPAAPVRDDTQSPTAPAAAEGETNLCPSTPTQEPPNQRTDTFRDATEEVAPPSPPPAPPVMTEEERIADIKRRRAPPDGHDRRSDALNGFWKGTPILFIFFYWLIYFLCRALRDATARALRPYAPLLKLQRPYMPLAAMALLAFLWSAFTLIRYAAFIWRTTFFLSQLPINSTPQAVTNPSADMVRALSIAEGTQTFELHPLIDGIVRRAFEH